MHAKYANTVLCDCGFDGADIALSVQSKPCSIGIRTVSHTLEGHLAEQLRYVAFRERLSESAVIEFALRELLFVAEDDRLGQRMREGGATLRRKVK